MFFSDEKGLASGKYAVKLEGFFSLVGISTWNLEIDRSFVTVRF